MRTNILYGFGELFVVPVEGKRRRGRIRIECGVGANIVGHEFHRRGWNEGPQFDGSDNELGSQQETKIKNSRRSVDSMEDSAWEAAREAEHKAARTSETTPVPAPSTQSQF